MSEKIIHIKNYISDKCFDLLKIGKFISHIQNLVNLNNLQPRLWYDMSLSLWAPFSFSHPDGLQWLISDQEYLRLAIVLLLLPVTLPGVSLTCPAYSWLSLQAERRHGGFRRPEFVLSDSSNVTAILGSPATLTCRVRNVNNRTVSPLSLVCVHLYSVQWYWNTSSI